MRVSYAKVGRMTRSSPLARAKESPRPTRPICSPGTTATPARGLAPGAWRARRGERPDPYRVWLSEIMLQQTTVKTVAPYYARFLARWPTVEALAAASLDDVLRAWAGLGYYARARNLHACAQGRGRASTAACFRTTSTRLRALPGIGDYTAAAIAAIAFDAPAVPVDGNVERVVARLFAVEEELPAAKPRDQASSPRRCCRARRAGDFAQALMDLGATICTPKRPACALLPVERPCLAARARRCQETFPRKAPKREGKLRRGAAFVALRADGRVLLRRRPDKGLLAAMTEVPGSDWTHDFDDAARLARGAALQGQSRMAQAAGRGETRVHAFPARTDRVRRASAAHGGGAQGCALGPAARSLPAKPCRT